MFNQKIGVVRKWDYSRGFGFIEVDDDDGDLFVHISSIDGNKEYLSEGDEVTFNEEFDKNRGKTRAAHVKTTGIKRTLRERVKGWRNNNNLKNNSVLGKIMKNGCQCEKERSSGIDQCIYCHTSMADWD